MWTPWHLNRLSLTAQFLLQYECSLVEGSDKQWLHYGRDVMCSLWQFFHTSEHFVWKRKCNIVLWAAWLQRVSLEKPDLTVKEWGCTVCDVLNRLGNPNPLNTRNIRSFQCITLLFVSWVELSSTIFTRNISAIPISFPGLVTSFALRTNANSGNDYSFSRSWTLLFPVLWTGVCFVPPTAPGYSRM